MSPDLLRRVEEVNPATSTDTIPDGVWDAEQVLEAIRLQVDLPIRYRRRSYRPWLTFATAAAVVLLVVGGLAWLTGQGAVDVVDQPASTTVPTQSTTTVPDQASNETAEPLPGDDGGAAAEPPWSVEDLPATAEWGTLDTPLGPASWVKLSLDENTRPATRCFVFDADDGYGGCQGPGKAMPWPSGFAIFQPTVYAYPPPSSPPFGTTRLWVSMNGVDWRDESQSLPSDVIATGGSLTLDNGVYWLLSEEPTGLWYTTDGSTWVEIDPTGLAPPGSVGPNWERGYTPPVTASELTLTYGSFWGDHFPRDFEQRIYIIDETGVTPVEVPWPPVVDATLFSTGESIYAYTVDGQSEQATRTVWRTTDGVSWQEMGSPGFVEASGATAKSFGLYPTMNGRLIAWSHELRGAVWETSDGVNWDAVDLPPLPSVNGARDVSPVLLDTGWFAATGGRGGSWDGGIWWMKAADSWFQLVELQIPGDPTSSYGVAHTTFFFGEDGMWVMHLDPTE